MDIIQLLKSPYINLSAIALSIYPDKPKQNARALLRNKVFEINGNRLNDSEKTEIKKILKNICIVL